MNLTTQQIEELADIRTQHDLNQNNFGSNSHKTHELVSPVNWHAAYEKFGLSLNEAEAITWPVIWERMRV